MMHMSVRIQNSASRIVPRGSKRYVSFGRWGEFLLKWFIGTTMLQFVVHRLLLSFLGSLTFLLAFFKRMSRPL